MVRVYINGHVIAANKKHNERAPPISVAKGRTITRGHRVDLIGPARVIYAPDKPLPCGATVWIECTDAVLETL